MPLPECSGKADIAFAIDRSGSIRRERFDSILEFVQRIITELEVGDNSAQVSVMSWGNDSLLEFPFNNHYAKQDVIQAVHYVHYTGDSTNTAMALSTLRREVFNAKNGDRPDAPNYVFFLSDGVSNIDDGTTVREAVRNRLEGEHIITVSIGDWINRWELQNIASEDVQENMITVGSYEDLSELWARMPFAVCNGKARACCNCLLPPCMLHFNFGPAIGSYYVTSIVSLYF